MRRGWILWIGCLLAGGGSCWADEASHRQAVDELFAQIDMAATVDQTVQQVAAALTGAVPEDLGYRDVVDAYVRKYIAWEALKDEVAERYMQAFTEEEIGDLIAFYNTAAGRKLLAQSPVIGREVAVSVHRRLVEHSPELKQMMMDADFRAFQDSLSQDESLVADPPR
ncbi:MAG TPA: hypothetical protein DCM68_04960 [Verrucomicrobia bacterium]|nr:hypothetical protein [Verrucomicrobiota bacterium]